jgi:Leucine-rich repeat (LRR) protein
LLIIRYLDLSFNVISKIENVEQLINLESLYLIGTKKKKKAFRMFTKKRRQLIPFLENKISELPEDEKFANKLTKLTRLELG